MLGACFCVSAIIATVAICEAGYYFHGDNSNNNNNGFSDNDLFFVLDRNGAKPKPGKIKETSKIKSCICTMFEVVPLVSNATGKILFGSVELTPATADNVWTVAWTRNLSEQSLINNVIKEIFNALTRIIGWLSLELLLYGGGNLIPSSF